MPGQEEAEIPVFGRVGIQSRKSHMCPQRGTGNGKVSLNSAVEETHLDTQMPVPAYPVSKQYNMNLLVGWTQT